MFYETRDVAEKNRPLKDLLNGFYHAQSEDVKQRVFRLAVINCSGAVWPFTRIWKHKLVEHSKKEALTIYGDWDGEMFARYGMKDGESNVLVIDRHGIIRYRADGLIESDEAEKIRRLVSELSANP